MFESADDWGDYPDERRAMGMGGLGRLGSMGGIVYVPDLAPVGSGASYYPRSVADDIRALVFLGYLTDQAAATIVPTTGTQAGDMNSAAGAWDDMFQTAVRAFQASAGIGVDGWTGPNTRRALATAVAAKNAQEVIPPIPPPVPPPPIPPLPPNVLPPGPGPAPAPPGPGPAPSAPNYLLYGGIAAGVVAVLGIGYWALSD